MIGESRIGGDGVARARARERIVIMYNMPHVSVLYALNYLNVAHEIQSYMRTHRQADRLLPSPSPLPDRPPASQPVGHFKTNIFV